MKPEVLKCDIYRCNNKDGMYLYVEHESDLSHIPDLLKKKTGKLELAMTLDIALTTKLAQADAEKVLQALKDQGFYLQMPLSHIDYMQEVNKANHFLGKDAL